MITLHKNGGVKVLSPESTLIPVLKEKGWVAEGDTLDEDHPAPEKRRGRPAKNKEKT